MKSLLISAVLLLTSSAFANPFNGFSGTYKATSAPIISGDNVDLCNWLNFDKITGIEVSNQVLTVLSTEGQMEVTVTDFTESSLLGARGQYAKTSGSKNAAIVELGTWGFRTDGLQIVVLEKTSKGYLLSLKDYVLENSQATSACYYEVQLKKQ